MRGGPVGRQKGAPRIGGLRICKGGGEGFWFEWVIRRKDKVGWTRERGVTCEERGARRSQRRQGMQVGGREGRVWVHGKRKRLRGRGESGGGKIKVTVCGRRKKTGEKFGGMTRLLGKSEIKQAMRSIRVKSRKEDDRG